MLDFKVVIGCEIHVQLNLKSKAFCSCKNEFGGIPNSRTCPTCLGLPGALPRINKALIEKAIIAGYALNCDISKLVKFDRKHYIYPDLPKGYQISQYDLPICFNGHIKIKSGEDSLKKINIVRIHMEEDSAKILNIKDSSQSYIDFNRAGSALLEIVSSPDIENSSELITYIQDLREILEYLYISDCNMEKGSLRCDLNINLKIKEQDNIYATPIVEIKNLNSFKSMRLAIDYEIERQKQEWINERLTLESVGKYTRGFDEKSSKTILQRKKETLADYRYFQEPDLPLVSLDDSYLSLLREKIVELPREARERLKRAYNLSDFDVVTLTSDKNLLNFYDKAALNSKHHKKLANWILTEVLAYVNEREISILDFPLPPSYISELVEYIAVGKVSGKMAKDIFLEMIEKNKTAKTIIEEGSNEQISDENIIRDLILKVISLNPKSIELYKKGKDNSIKFLMGQIMRESQGRVNPQLAKQILLEELRGL